MSRSQDLQSCTFSLIFINLILISQNFIIKPRHLSDSLNLHQRIFPHIYTSFSRTEVLYVIRAVVIKQLLEYKLWDYF